MFNLDFPKKAEINRHCNSGGILGDEPGNTPFLGKAMLQDRTEVGSNPVQWTDLNKLEHFLNPFGDFKDSSLHPFPTQHGLNPQGDGRGLFHVIEQLAALEVEIASFWMKLGEKTM